ncbi:MAG: hypothetical protein FWE80_10220, partial [Oscillospiraceae bacterium]|nr:hypothetical protein [Oscillospiraceae bacterium]
MRHTGKIYGSLILAMIIIAALILPASAAGVIGDSTGGTVQSINWEKHSNSFFDAAFTESRSQAFGDGSKDHIQLSGNSAKFFGYETTSYIDYLYYKEANPGKQTFTFSISADETTDFHALCTISFLMNCVQVNGKYSGYMFSIEEGKMAIRILDDLDLDKISNPEDPDFDSRIGNKLIGFRTSEELCPVIDSKSYTTKSGDVFNVKLVSMNTSFTVTVINAETKAVVYNYTLNPADASAKPNAAYAGGNDFGLLCSYDSVDHWCDWLSRAEYQNLTLTSGSINEIVEDEDTGIKLEVGVGVLPVKTIFKVLPVSKGLEFDTINK